MLTWKGCGYSLTCCQAVQLGIIVCDILIGGVHMVDRRKAFSSGLAFPLLSSMTQHYHAATGAKFRYRAK